jgi:RHS repeat-associated protein
LQNLSYVYDQVGNVRTITDSVAGETQVFRYDALDRLTSATVTGGPAPYTEKYTYDALTGNLATKASSTNQPADNPGITGLVAWWSMDETSGVRKDSYYENHLTDINTVGSATGRKDKAADFVTANLEHLTVADNALLSGGDVDFTLVANVYLDNNTNTFVIMDKSDAASAYDYRIAHQAGTGFRFRVSASTYVDSGAVTANAWHTVIAWHDSVNDTINIQVDHGTVNSVAFSDGTLDTANPLSIGAFANGTMGLDGRLDEVAIYKRVLTSNQRAWLHNNGLGRSYAEVANPVTYTYDTSTTDGDPAHPHAVASLSNTNGYKYDANGNQIKRIIGTDTYDLIYDEENRLDEVKKNNVLIAKFYYDADGRRVKSVMGSVTTLFIGPHYEVTNPDTPQKVITKYYLAGSQRIAMRVGNTLTFLHSDHLGSTSLTTDLARNETSEMRYTAWGEVRYATTTSTSLPAPYTYTGQFSDMDDLTTAPEEGFGLMFYNARWYDPYLNHMTQPDIIVPDSYNPQDWDRYNYARNNPLRYTDPSGHIACDDQDENGKCINYEQNLFREINKNYSDWERRILRKLYNKGGPDAVHAVDYIVANEIHIKVGTPVKNVGYLGGLYIDGDWQSLGKVQGWYEGNDFVVLNPNKGYSNGQMPDPWGLATIVHEALHIEQGGLFGGASTKDSELEAYQAGLRVDMELEGKTLSDLEPYQQDLYNSTSGWDYGQKWKQYDYDGYWQTLRLAPPWWP